MYSKAIFNSLFSAPPVSVQISHGGVTPTAGENYQLVCSVSGAENLNPTISYRWTNNSGSGQTQVGTSSNILSFIPLRLSDAASYVCEVTIASNYLTGDIVAVSVNSQDVRIQSEFYIRVTNVFDNACIDTVPTPSSLMLRSNLVTVLFGSDVTLTCTLGLNSTIAASDLSLLSVDVQLSRNGSPLTRTDPTVTDTALIYNIGLNSFSITEVGNYTCNATIRPRSNATYLNVNASLLSNELLVTTGEIIPEASS